MMVVQIFPADSWRKKDHALGPQGEAPGRGPAHAMLWCGKTETARIAEAVRHQTWRERRQKPALHQRAYIGAPLRARTREG